MDEKQPYEFVDAEKQYDFVSGQVRYHNDKILEAFYAFVRLFIGIVGGSFWLSLQPKITVAMAPKYANLSVGLLFLVAAVATFMIFENLRAWHGFRNAQSRLAGTDETGSPRIPPPRLIRASLTEISMVATIWIATSAFWYWNPFTLIFAI